MSAHATHRKLTVADGLPRSVDPVCAGDNTVAALIAGGLDATAALRLEEHLDGCPACRQLVARLGQGISALDRLPREGELVGRYEVGRVIGVGGMGVVYEAHDTVLHRRVALKLLRPDHGCDARLLLAEARAMARLSHRNVVAIHDAGTEHGRVYLCMELVVGTTLREWLTDRSRSPREIIAMFAEAGAGLAYIHGERLVHLDFKPDNVLVARGGRPAVTDFGVAAMIGRGSIGGTPRYMAPEQHRGEPADARADQYAFCTALEEALGDAAPGWAQRVIARGRSAHALDRFGSMAELVRVLAAGLGRTRRRITALLGVIAASGVALLLARSPSIITRLIDRPGSTVTQHDRIIERVVGSVSASEVSSSSLALATSRFDFYGHVGLGWLASNECAVQPEAAFAAGVAGDATNATRDRVEAGACDDGGPVTCAQEPPWCPPGSMVSVHAGCWSCSTEPGCIPLGTPHACDDGSPLRCALARPTCAGGFPASIRGGCWECADPFTCTARSASLPRLAPLTEVGCAGCSVGSGVGSGSGVGHPVCGNGFCEAGEDHASCAADCCELVGSSCAPVCGNGFCEQGESHGSCASDCCALGSDGECH